MCSTLKYYTIKLLTYYNHYYYYCCCCCYHIMKVVFKNRGQGSDTQREQFELYTQMMSQ
uniref:Uncharacterized protein n=1 Tax=Anguilla anguilla TaxID=7936 RepID=A0A0E9T4V8_ANGAN